MSKTVGVTLLAVILVVGSLAFWHERRARTTVRADPADASLVSLGRIIYDKHCASCHGFKLEGQPDWRARLPSGRMPAPPHDASGHTWHHPDDVLFDITKGGVQTHAPKGYQSDMPAFGGVLDDSEIWAALSYIKSMWPPEIRDKHSLMNRE